MAKIGELEIARVLTDFVENELIPLGDNDGTALSDRGTPSQPARAQCADGGCDHSARPVSASKK